MVDLKKLEIVQRHLAGDTNRQIARDIGLTTICCKIAKRRHPRPEAFVTQAYEYDFGKVHLELGGRFTKLFMAVMVVCTSGYRYALLYARRS